nr:MAG TPA: hypothetical protein [Caudoviricetes sp.]
MKYTIYDVRDGLLGDDKTVEAKSPIEAVRKFYNNVKRVKNGGDIVVNSSYCYVGDRKKNDNEKRV